MSRRIDQISLPILALELAPPIRSLKIDLPPSPRIAQQIQPEVSRKTVAAQVVAIAPWVDMSPATMRGHPAIEGNPASREIRSPLGVAETAAAVLIRIAAVAVEMAEAARIAAVAQIAVAEKRANEELL
jgi:hypothetical protein